ncbi:MAG: sterol desaturase family protein [Saprospiraceae bacterium]|jgi:sterol desaturase/sphingolipid hydroxylase (fatty acid hydroxylase superfamily)|nr:sterol desaturase family protein [Saprospiraceae bacterium]
MREDLFLIIQKYNFIVYAILFISLWNIENIFGVSKNYNKWSHSLINFWFIIPGYIIQGVLGAEFGVVLKFENSIGFGISSISTIWQVLIAFLVLDLFYYLYHVVMHRYNLLWKVHAVHHSDTVLNVSTSLREHPFETVIRLSLYILCCCAIGPLLWIILFHQFVQVLSKIIIHSNIRLPDKFDYLLSFVFITPNMHQVHHHFKRPYTDSNFGDLFSIWDRLFGTMMYLSKEQVIFGLDQVETEKSKSIKSLVLINLSETYHV